jgi:hypothetical protein
MRCAVVKERGIDINEELKKGYGRGKRRLLPNSITIGRWGLGEM